MKKFFEPKSIAIVGASLKEGKIGNALLKNLSSQDEIKIFPVNPSAAGESEGDMKFYSNVSEIPESVDLAVIAIPAKFVLDVVKECGEREDKIENIVIISAGFSEAGEEGVKREEDLKKIAKEYDLKILGPNCLGVINTGNKMNASFAKSDTEVGNIGLISQSGAFVTALFDVAPKEGLGFSLVATLGNKAVVGGGDLLKFYAEDENTKIIALYLEDIKDGERFRKTLREITKKKPVVIIKSGLSERAKSAIQSHTGAMAGEAAVIQEVIAESGGIFCDNLQDFVGVLKILSGFSTPKSDKIAIVTNAGGPGVITTDLVERKSSFELFEFSKEQKEALQKNLPEESSVENPIDLLGDAMEDRYQKILEELAKIKNLGAILVLVTPQSQTPIEKISEAVIFANEKMDIPVLPVVIGGEAGEVASKVLAEKNLHNFNYPYEAIKALEAWQQSAVAIEKLSGEKLETKRDENRTKECQEILQKAIDEKRGALFYTEARELGIKYELEISDAAYDDEIAEGRKVEFPVVVKVDSPNILHKNAKEGVVLNIRNEEELTEMIKTFKERFGDEKILVQHQLDAGFELIIGLKKDESFGHVLLIGLGGIFTEILEEKLLFLMPVSKEVIEEKIRSSKIGEVLEKERLNISEVVDASFEVAQMAMENDNIAELDINPIMLYKDQSPVIVDIKILPEI